MAEAAYAGWKADMLAGKVTLMASAHMASVTRLSARARADRVRAGQGEAGGVILHDGNLAGQGAWIVTPANDRRRALPGGRACGKHCDAWPVAHRPPHGARTGRQLTPG